MVKRTSCVILLGLCGCAEYRSARGPLYVPPPVGGGAVAAYRIGCPDLLELKFAQRPGYDAFVTVDVDGQIDLGPPGAVRVQGLTCADAASVVAAKVEVPLESVEVRLADARACRVFITGPSNQRTRTVAYQGPDTAIEFLQKAGAILPGTTQLNDVFIVRGNVAVGRPPEVFHVDVAAVLLDGDGSSNIPIQPADHLYVGETRNSSFRRLLPDWLQPLYQQLAGLWPSSDDSRPRAVTPR